MKPQSVRLVDVFLLGPFMIYFGAAARNMPDLARALMVIAGAGTIVYNGKNYLEAKERGLHEQ